jgi:hypothetical protein
MLPGNEVTISDTPAAQPDLTSTGTLFVAALADRGPLAPVEIRSLEDLERTFGPRVSYSQLHDALRAFLGERGTRAVVSRIVGPGATTASVNLAGTTGTALIADASSPGDWAHAYSVDVDDAAGKRVVRVLKGTTEVERSPECATNDDLITWSQNTRSGAIVRLRLGAGSGLVTATASATAFAGGADDRTNVTDAHRRAALERIPAELGPGQLVSLGGTTSTANVDLFTVAAATNRFAYAAAPKSATVADLVTLAGALRALGAIGRRGQLFAQYATIPGTIAGTTVDVPYGVVQAGMTARVDAAQGTHTPAAGRNGVSEMTVALSATYTDAERRQLADAGVTVARVMGGRARTYDIVTLADPVTDGNWVDAAGARVVMRIAAEFAELAEDYDFRTIDGEGRALAQFGNELRGLLLRHWRSGALYGATPDEAFRVESGPAINPPARLLDGYLRAATALRTSPHPRRVQVDLSKTPITQAV